MRKKQELKICLITIRYENKFYMSVLYQLRYSTESLKLVTIMKNKFN